MCFLKIVALSRSSILTITIGLKEKFYNIDLSKLDEELVDRWPPNVTDAF